MRFPILRFILIFAIHAIAVPPNADGQDNRVWRQPEGSLCRLERQLVDDAADGRFDEHDLFRASLVACGIGDRRELATVQQRFAVIRESCRKADDPQSTIHQRAERIFTVLHNHVLSGQYEAETTDVQSAVSGGAFNCVSATVLYLCLARDIGLDVQTIAQPGHVYCRINDSEPFDIQTTSPNGFGIQTFDSVASRADEPASMRRAISEVQLVAKIYYNRGVAMLRHDRYADAYQMLAISNRMDSNDAMARRNLLACINNWTLSMCGQKRFSIAAELLNHGLAMAPDFSPFADNDAHVRYQWAMHLCQLRDYPRALTLLDETQPQSSGVVSNDESRLAVYKKWIRDLEQSGRHSEAQTVMSTARQSFPESFPSGPSLQASSPSR